MIIEALLFSSDKPLSVKDINDCVPDSDKSEIRNALKILQHDYEVLERSFILKEVAQGYQFRSRPEYGSYILRMFQKTPNRLSRAAMETLAIIAYKQPILRNEIERLRGVDVGGIIKTLMEKELIKIMGRKELPGRPLVYGTTKRFLEVFDLKDLSSLPKLKEIKEFGTDEYEPTAQAQGDGDEEIVQDEPTPQDADTAGAAYIQPEPESDMEPDVDMNSEDNQEYNSEEGPFFEDLPDDEYEEPDETAPDDGTED